MRPSPAKAPAASSLRGRWALSVHRPLAIQKMISSYSHSQIFLEILGCRVRIECRDPKTRDLILGNYGGMQGRNSGRSHLDYVVETRRRDPGFRIARRGSEPQMAADDGEFLFILEKDMTIELQKLRRDLYFIHAAALTVSRQAFLLVAAPQKGKSTTTWALLHHGFGYLSDELAPLDLDSLEVLPYPHAICLKKEPPYPYSLPDKALRTSSTLHIPTPELPNSTCGEPLPLKAIFFIEYCADCHSPAICRLSQAETAARLFAHALNPLAHAEDGLAGAVAIARKVPAFHLDSGDLRPTCALINETLERADEANVYLSA
jgi:hypothetical protein